MAVLQWQSKLTISLHALRWKEQQPSVQLQGQHLSSTLALSKGGPQGCVPSHNTNTIVKFADDMTVVGLITKGDESAYREEVQRLTEWCTENNLILNIEKQKQNRTHNWLQEEAEHPCITAHQWGESGGSGGSVLILNAYDGTECMVQGLCEGCDEWLNKYLFIIYHYYFLYFFY